MNKSDAVYVAGHRGLVGSAIVRKLEQEGYSKIITRNRRDLDLLDQAAVRHFFRQNHVNHVVVAAGKVGGVLANSLRQADFLYENLMIAANLTHAAAQSGVDRFLFLGSSCAYPQNASQPMKEKDIMSSPLEGTSEGYAVAKIAGMKLCEMYSKQHKRRFISAIPANLYGPNDNFHSEDSHVIPGMMRRFHEARMIRSSGVKIWGTGNPVRDFLHVEDLADAMLVLMRTYNSPDPINIGGGAGCSIRELAGIMKEVTGFEGDIVYDQTKPDGAPSKVLNNSRILELGWQPRIELRKGLQQTYAWALEQKVFSR